VIFWVAAASIAAIVAAIAGVASAIIYWKTLKSVSEQTEISRKQFEVALRRQEEPDLTVTPGDFVPSGQPEGTGRLPITVHNCGLIPLRNLRVKVLVTTSHSVLIIHGPLSISPGRSQAVKGIIFISPQLGPLDAEIVCEFETPVGRRFQKRDRWNLSFYRVGHDLLRSSPVEEVEET
jgi:hypothetical protein